MSHPRPMARRVGTASWLVVLAVLAITGCAGRAPAPRDEQPEARSVPDRIRHDEALIEDAMAETRDDTRACPDRCRSAAAVCEAADRICAVVSELRDVSLAPRCDHARASCTEARTTVSACGCTMTP